jgi:hypothetical protein
LEVSRRLVRLAGWRSTSSWGSRTGCWLEAQARCDCRECEPELGERGDPALREQLDRVVDELGVREQLDGLEPGERAVLLAFSPASGSRDEDVLGRSVHAVRPRVEALARLDDLGYVPLGPVANRSEHGNERLAKWSQRVLDRHRHSRERLSRHETVALEATERLREHLLRDALDAPAKLAEPVWTLRHSHDKRRPTVADAM